MYLERLGPDENEAQDGDKRDSHDKRREHNAHELTVGNTELGIEIEVLRIAEGGEHTAEVGGYILHYVGERHILFLARGVQDEVAERQEGQERHIVGNQHRADKGDVYEGENA